MKGEYEWRTHSVNLERIANEVKVVTSELSLDYFFDRLTSVHQLFDDGSIINVHDDDNEDVIEFITASDVFEDVCSDDEPLSQL